ncbi:rod shape-determining protein MreC [Caldicellulosiruptoraceae bacterium PP1]
MKKRLIAIIIILIFIFSINATIYSIKTTKSLNFSKVIRNLFVPSNSILYKISNNINQYIYDIIHLKDIKNENIKLKSQLQKLKTDKETIDEIKFENEKLKQLLGLQESQKNNAELITARIVLRSPDSWFNTLIADKGSNYGIKPNMVVVNNQGLVGYIVEVGYNWAKIQTVLDSNFAASAIVTRTRDIGVIKGREDMIKKGLCKLFYISKDSDVSLHDIVMTSGMGDIFPKGILIGEVLSVKNDEKDLTKDITIKPAVDYNNIEYVFIIKKIKNISFSVGVK